MSVSFFEAERITFSQKCLFLENFSKKFEKITSMYDLEEDQLKLESLTEIENQARALLLIPQINMSAVDKEQIDALYLQVRDEITFLRSFLGESLNYTNEEKKTFQYRIENKQESKEEKLRSFQSLLTFYLMTFFSESYEIAGGDLGTGFLS